MPGNRMEHSDEDERERRHPMRTRSQDPALTQSENPLFDDSEGEEPSEEVETSSQEKPKKVLQETQGNLYTSSQQGNVRKSIVKALHSVIDEISEEKEVPEILNWLEAVEDVKLTLERDGITYPESMFMGVVNERVHDSKRRIMNRWLRNNSDVTWTQFKEKLVTELLGPHYTNVLQEYFSKLTRDPRIPYLEWLDKTFSTLEFYRDFQHNLGDPINEFILINILVQNSSLEIQQEYDQILSVYGKHSVCTLTWVRTQLTDIHRRHVKRKGGATLSQLSTLHTRGKQKCKFCNWEVAAETTGRVDWRKHAQESCPYYKGFRKGQSSNKETNTRKPQSKQSN
jgi:hypothetical protein